MDFFAASGYVTGGLLRLNMEYKYGGIGGGVVDIKNHREYKCRAI